MKILFPLIFSLSFCKGLQECGPDRPTSFGIITGYVLNSSDGKSLIRTLPGVNGFAECLASCSEESSCLSANYKTGLCMLFADKPDSPPEGLVKSQYPIFSMFGWKVCITGVTCPRAWAVEVVPSVELTSTGLQTLNRTAISLEGCYQQCLSETQFNCRSANYHRESGLCALSKADRFTESSTTVVLEDNPNIDYIESNCDHLSSTGRPSVCNFNEKKGYIIGTADSVIAGVKSLKECNTLCLKEKLYKCRAFDFNETASGECRLSHLSSQSLQQSENAYFKVIGAVTHQLSSCYNVTIDCKANEMVARVDTDKAFSGKIYSKDQPKSCVQDVKDSTNFEIRLGYNELECNVAELEPGKFTTNLIIQHHDQIITGMDVEMSVSCFFDLRNNSIYRGVKISVNGDPETIGTGEATFAITPSVTMQITDRKGHDVHTAKVGDALSLRFHILDNDTSYEIFVRELVALDGVGSSEILLIDSLGCPTDPTIMGPISTVSDRNAPQILEAPFDAFKFPTSDLVQFKALVTPCLPSCEPVNCSVEDYYGIVRKVDSYGRRKRELNGKGEIVFQAIRIQDKFKFNTVLLPADDSKIFKGFDDTCLNIYDVVIAFIVFAVIQLGIAVILVVLRQHYRFNNTQTQNTLKTLEPQYCQFFRLP